MFDGLILGEDIGYVKVVWAYYKIHDECFELVGVGNIPILFLRKKLISVTLTILLQTTPALFLLQTTTVSVEIKIIFCRLYYFFVTITVF